MNSLRLLFIRSFGLLHVENMLCLFEHNLLGSQSMSNGRI
uniref:Uncharacterized protein n=1 Tax=Anguilla anguilla TaxID=7936 RepID=A0A0E9TV68_ANGAN